jgi:hypothetical protein
MITGAYLTATLGTAPIDGTHEWSYGETTDRLEATTGADNGRGRKDGGVTDARIKIRFYFDIATGQARFIRANTVLANLKLYHDAAADAPLVLVTSARVFDFNVVGQVRDRFVVDADIEPLGDVITFTDPA